MAGPLRIALVHCRDADDVRVWSGTPYFAKRAVERHVGEVIDLSPAPLGNFFYRLASKFFRLMGKGAPHDQFLHYARALGRYFSDRLARDSYDLVFVPSGKEVLAFLETDVPIIYYSDATWRAVEDYYSVYTNVVPFLSRNGELLERRSIDKSSILLYASSWAADSAVKDYGADPANVHVLYIGANLMHPPRREEVLLRALGNTVRLLLVGVDWQIKGGSVALEVLKRLLELGYDARLTVVGCTAPEGVAHPRMEVIPFLNKQIPEERERFERIWSEADFFLLPSRFEAAGIVFCEAGAHGLPSLAARTGGIPSLIVDGKNGFTVPHEEEPESYVEKIVALINDPEGYAALCRGARDEYEARLNWDAWGARFAEIVAGRFPHLRERIRKQ